MANRNETAKVFVDVDGKNAATELKNLETRAKELKTQLIELGKANDKAGFDRANKELKLVSSEMKSLKKETFDVTNVLKNLNGTNFNDLRKAQSQITAELKRMERGTQDYVTKSNQLKLVEAELKKVKAEMYGVAEAGGGSMWSKMSNGFSMISGKIFGMVAAFAGISLAIKNVVESYNEYEKRVANLSALTGLQGEDLNWISDQAKKMSVETDKMGIKITASAGDIVDAFTKMGSAKPELLKDKEALAAVTKEALTLAAAAGMETVPAVEGLANVMNQFNAPATEASRFINVLAAGSKEGAAEIEDISASIIKFGSAASGMNISVEQSVALIEALSEKGIKGEIAGTGLKNVLLKLQTAGDDSLNPALVGINTALENLKNKGLTATEMVKLFGMENFTVASNLVNLVPRINDLTKAVTGTSVAYDQAKTNTATNSAVLEQAKNKTRLMAIELGEKLTPVLTMAANGFAALMKGIVAIIKFYVEHSKVINVLILTLVAYTLATKVALMWEALKNAESKVSIALAKLQVFWDNALTAAKLLLSAATALLSGNIKKATESMKAFFVLTKMHPIGLLVAAVVALGAALYMFTRRSDEATESQKRFADAQQEIQKRMAQEKADLDLYQKRIESTNIGTKERADLIQELNDKYGTYLGYVISETASNQELTMALSKVNAELEKKIQREVYSEKIKGIIQKEIEMDDKKLSLQTEYNKLKEHEFQNKGLIMKKQKEIEAVDIYLNELAGEKNKYLNKTTEIITGINTELKKSVPLFANFNNITTNTPKAPFTGKNIVSPLTTPLTDPKDTPTGGGGGGKSKKQQEKEDLDKYLEDLKKAIDKNQREIEQEMLNANEREIQIIRDKYTKELETLKINEDLIKKIRFKESTGAELSNVEIAQLKVYNQVQQQMLTEMYKKKEEQEKKYQENIYNIKKNADLLTNKDIYEHDLANLNDSYAKKLIDEEEYQLKKMLIIKAYDDAELNAAKEKQKKLDEFNQKYGTGVKKEGIAGLKEELGGLDEKKKTEIKNMEDEAMLLGVTNTSEKRFNIEMKYLNMGLDLEQEIIRKKLAVAEKYVQAYSAIVNAIGDMVSAAKENEALEIDAINNRETKNFDASLKKQFAAFNKQKAAEIAAAKGDKAKIEAIEKKYADKKAKMDEENQAKKEALDIAAEERKKELQKKYAAIELKITIAKIIASTALAVINAFATLPLPAAIVAAAIIGITGGIQIANAVKQKNAVMQMDSGGMVDVTGDKDGRQYNAKYMGPAKTGLYSNPSLFLAAEKNPEYVIDYNTMQHPSVINYVGAIENIRLGRSVPQFAEGGYTGTVKSGSTNASDPVLQMLINTVGYLTQSVQVLNGKLGIPFRAFISYDDLQQADEDMAKVENDSTFTRST